MNSKIPEPRDTKLPSTISPLVRLALTSASVIPVIAIPSSNFSKAIRKVTVSSSVTTGADTVPTNPISPSPPLYIREISSGVRASSYIRRSSICPAKYWLLLKGPGPPINQSPILGSGSSFSCKAEVATIRPFTKVES